MYKAENAILLNIVNSGVEGAQGSKKKLLQYCYRANCVKSNSYYNLNTLLIFIGLTPFKIKGEVVFKGAELYI